MASLSLVTGSKDTDVCSLHIQLMDKGTPPEVDLESSKSPAKSGSWNKPSRCPRDNIVGSHLCDECMKSILPNVCHKLLSIW